MFESFSKSRKSWNGRQWFGNAFQIFEATDANDLEAVMVVLRGGTHIEKNDSQVYLTSLCNSSDAEH